MKYTKKDAYTAACIGVGTARDFFLDADKHADNVDVAYKHVYNAMCAARDAYKVVYDVDVALVAAANAAQHAIDYSAHDADVAAAYNAAYNAANDNDVVVACRDAYIAADTAFVRASDADYDAVFVAAACRDAHKAAKDAYDTCNNIVAKLNKEAEQK